MFTSCSYTIAGWHHICKPQGLNKPEPSNHPKLSPEMHCVVRTCYTENRHHQAFQNIMYIQWAIVAFQGPSRLPSILSFRLGLFILRAGDKWTCSRIPSSHHFTHCTYQDSTEELSPPESFTPHSATTRLAVTIKRGLWNTKNKGNQSTTEMRHPCSWRIN